MIQIDSIHHEPLLNNRTTSMVISMEVGDKRVTREINFLEVKIEPMLGAALTIIKTINEMEKSGK